MVTFGIPKMTLRPVLILNVIAPIGIDSEPFSPVQKQSMQQEPNKKIKNNKSDKVLKKNYTLWISKSLQKPQTKITLSLITDSKQPLENPKYLSQIRS